MNPVNYDFILQEPAFKEVIVNEPVSPLKKKPLPIPSTPPSVKKMRKDHLEGVSDSPFKRVTKTKYGKCPFSKKIVDWKKKNDITAGRNAAIVVFQSPRSKTKNYTIAVTNGPPGAPHGELKAFDAVPKEVRRNPENILAVYSERVFCRHGSNCHCKLKSVVTDKTEMFYSKEGVGRKLELEFQQVQAGLGVRVSSAFKRQIRNKY